VAGKRVVISVRVSEAEAEAIDGVRGGLGRAAWVETVVEAALRQGETAKKKVKRDADACPHPRGRVIKGFCYRCGGPAT
jgi:hypothetical protein